jgi:ribosomal protein L16 Arg81 hydroxylase
MRMSLKAFNLAKVLAPIETGQFFAEYWEKQPLVIARDDPHYFADLLSKDAVDHIVTSSGLRYPGFRLVKSGSPVPLSDYTVDLPWGKATFDGTANVDSVLALFQQGYSIVLEALHRTWPPIAIFCRSLEQELNCPVQTNVYFTPQASQGFAPHYDTHDVFVLQISGTKHWRIYGSPVELPNGNIPYQPSMFRPDDLLLKVDLQPGDMIYMPRGYVHEALTSDTDSLHLTVGIVSYTWMDILAELLSIHQQDLRFRTSLPLGFGVREDILPLMKDQFEGLLNILSQSPVLDECIRRVDQRFVSSRSPMLAGSLKVLDNVNNLNIDTPLMRREGVIFRIVAEDSTIGILFHGKQIVMPAYVEPCIRFISMNEHFTPRHLPGMIDNEGKIVLVSRLIREGFLTLHDNVQQ